MNEVENKQEASKPPTIMIFNKYDGSAKSNIPPTPLSSLLNVISKDLVETSQASTSETNPTNSIISNLSDANDSSKKEIENEEEKPSFSNLTAGHLIAKGIDAEDNLDKANEEDENPVILLTEGTEQNQLQAREASKSHFGISSDIKNSSEKVDLDSISRKNLEKLTKNGCDASLNIERNKTEEAFIATPVEALPANHRNSSCSNFSSGKIKIKLNQSAGSEIREIDDILQINENEAREFDSLNNNYHKTSSEKFEGLKKLGFETNDNSEETGIQLKTDSFSIEKKNSRKIQNSFTSSSMNDDMISHEFGSNDDQPKPPPIDLKTVKTQKNFNDLDEGSQMPERLLQLIFAEFHHEIPEESIAYIALCGMDVIGYKERRINDAMLSLRILLKRCIELGFITESSYVQSVIERTKKCNNEFKKFNVANPVKLVQENLSTAKAKKEVKERNWNARLLAADSEHKMAISDLKKRYEEEKKSLDKKWNSKSSALKYQKVSPKLNEMKFVAKKMLETHRFEEAAALTRSIQENEDNESKTAIERREKDYRSAIYQLEKKFQNEQMVLENQFDVRKSMLKKREKIELMPLDRRVDKLKNKKEHIIEMRKRNPEKRNKSSLAASTKLPPNLTINNCLKLNLKNVVPEYKDSRKRATSRLYRSSSNQKNLSQTYS